MAGMFEDLIPKGEAAKSGASLSFEDLIPVAAEVAPSSGVTIAAKGQAPREATPEEAGQLEPGASMADVAVKAGENLGPSALQFGQDMANVVLHPVETGKNLLKVGMGGVQKVIPGPQNYEKYADSVGKFFADRYGGVENVKQTMAEDPVGFAADMATFLTGGQLALARAPGVAGTVGRVAGATSRAIDPINAAMQGARAAGKGIGKATAAVGGMTTGAGGGAIRTAARAGYEGGEAASSFRQHMRGNAPMDEAVNDAKAGLDAIRSERQAAYRAGMADVSDDAQVLDLSKVEQALMRTKAETTYKGVSINPSTDKTIGEMRDVLDEWRNLDPAEYHTAAGFDALKRRIGDIRENTQYGTPQRRVADQVYNIVKREITKQAPQYAKTMEKYSEASDLIREVEKTLSVNPNASIDTKLRKLQSVMRHNVNTNYGRRAELVRLLQDHGANHLMEKLAGQALNSIDPRGLSRAIAALGGIATGVGGVATLNPAVLVPFLAQLAIQSPRLWGEAAHAGGRVAKEASNLSLRGPAQAGYAVRELQRE